MKTFKEFIERLNSDKDFNEELNEKLKAKRESGATSVYETLIPAAAELGYEINEEEVDAMKAQAESELSEEELGKVAGGGSCFVVPFIITVSFAVTIIISND